MSAPETVVRDLLDRLAAGDVDRAVELLDADIVWKNTFLPTMRGPVVAHRLRELVARGVDFEVVFHHVAADASDGSGVVLTDRTDVLAYGAWRSEFRCRGTFEVRDGKVLVWDDSFSWLDVVGSGVAGLVRGILPR